MANAKIWNLQCASQPPCYSLDIFAWNRSTADHPGQWHDSAIAKRMRCTRQLFLECYPRKQRLAQSALDEVTESSWPANPCTRQTHIKQLQTLNKTDLFQKLLVWCACNCSFERNTWLRAGKASFHDSMTANAPGRFGARRTACPLLRKQKLIGLWTRNKNLAWQSSLGFIRPSDQVENPKRQRGGKCRRTRDRVGNCFLHLDRHIYINVQSFSIHIQKIIYAKFPHAQYQYTSIK